MSTTDTQHTARPVPTIHKDPRHPSAYSPATCTPCSWGGRACGAKGTV